MGIHLRRMTAIACLMTACLCFFSCKMAKEEKKRIAQENIRRVKDAGVKPWRMLLSIIFFVFTIIMLPKIFEQGVGPLDSFAWFYLAMALLATLIDVIQGNVQFRIGLIISTFLGYMFRMFLEVALIILSIPVIVLVFFLGPVMIIIFFVSSVILVVYFIESVLGRFHVAFKEKQVPLMMKARCHSFCIFQGLLEFPGPLLHHFLQTPGDLFFLFFSFNNIN